MNRITKLTQLARNMGLRYSLYRISHELEKKLGFLKRTHPTNLSFQHPISLSEWKETKNNLLITDRTRLSILKKQSAELKVKAERILKGELPYFNADWISLGKDYDWITNPSNGYRYDIKKHWSEIQDLSEEAGDIKYVWEKSRFSWLLTLIPYDHHFGEDLSEFVFSEIESWIDNNPINMGPNWRCSQEISLRIFNWYVALSYYGNSEALTERRWDKIQDVIYASLHHVYHHIDFSRIAVRNNHAITETLFLALSDVLFPFVPETKDWARKGRKWFEEEVTYQIYEDGTFLQFSMNYHRVVVQLLTLGISIAEKADRPFSKIVYDRAYKSLDFLYQCLQEENGWLPNYGSNDGALFFPWSQTDYRDYRPQLNTLHYLLTGKKLYTEPLLADEIFWWGVTPSLTYHFDGIEKFEGIKEYSVGGYLIIRDGNSFTFLRCGSHRDRPAQADNLHLDIWVDGKNILRDSGTYKYNTSADILQYFMGTQSHNSVLVDGHSQMRKGSRFIWYYWTQKIYTSLTETDDSFVFEGQIKAFQFLNRKATHTRKVTKTKGELKWKIQDVVLQLDGYIKKQVWHTDDHPVFFHAAEAGEVLKEQNMESFNSNYYGVKDSGKAVAFPFQQSVETTIEFKT